MYELKLIWCVPKVKHMSVHEIPACQLPLLLILFQHGKTYRVKKLSENALLSNTSNQYPTCSKLILHICDIQQSIISKGPAF